MSCASGAEAPSLSGSMPSENGASPQSAYAEKGEDTPRGVRARRDVCAKLATEPGAQQACGGALAALRLSGDLAAGDRDPADFLHLR
mmetsp:Transcript_27961/g.65290  ORF Transcript_27961/g.65290 Transcript_27961/m.65290 type:complete len:87 (+) Transcript_27961:1714-1974(+)